MLFRGYHSTLSWTDNQKGYEKGKDWEFRVKDVKDGIWERK
jgi:hypothetical protein